MYISYKPNAYKKMSRKISMLIISLNFLLFLVSKNFDCQLIYYR